MWEKDIEIKEMKEQLKELVGLLRRSEVRRKEVEKELKLREQAVAIALATSAAGYEGLGDDLGKFSDALEFQENEIMNAQDRLRSIRAKLAVSEGKMERLSTGIFCWCLKLYPGRHQIKFIVDGEWKIDPLRPIVHKADMRIIY